MKLLKKPNWLGGIIFVVSIYMAARVIPHYLGDSILSWILQFAFLIGGVIGVTYTGKRLSK